MITPNLTKSIDKYNILILNEVGAKLTVRILTKAIRKAYTEWQV